jgi:hypothetical protein
MYGREEREYKAAPAINQLTPSLPVSSPAPHPFTPEKSGGGRPI